MECVSKQAERGIALRFGPCAVVDRAQTPAIPGGAASTASRRTNVRISKQGVREKHGAGRTAFVAELAEIVGVEQVTSQKERFMNSVTKSIILTALAGSLAQ
jgi:hypothetical protein